MNFVPTNEHQHALANAGQEVPDWCKNCGYDFALHTNGRCPQKTDEPTQAIVHQVGEVPMRFTRLNAALKYCAQQRVTGYIALWTPECGAEVIKVRLGKRPGTKKGSWVPCA